MRPTQDHPDPVLDPLAGVEPWPGLDRRQFLKLLGGGIVVAFFLGDWDLLEAQAQRRDYPTDFNAYLRIGENGRVTVYSGKIEMGQGVVTSLAQMAADELGVPLDAIDMVLGDTELCPWDMGTFGSMSTRYFGPALRNAAAEAKGVLLALAAEELKTPPASLAAADGAVFVAADPKRRLTYGQIAQGRRIERHLAGKPRLRSLDELTVSGRSAARRDGHAKVTGQAKYAGDIRVPGMVYAGIVRPPAHGAKLTRLDTSAAERMPGVQVVRDGDLVATLAAKPDEAARALAAVKAEFDTPPATVDAETIFDRVVAGAPAPEERERKGDLAAGETASSAVFVHRYENGYGAHAPMEPHTALAHVEGDRVTVWASTQTPFPDRDRIAKELGFAPEKVRVITPFVGGGFGGKSGASGQTLEAVRLSRLAGKPVQVAWTRAEEFFYDTFRPAAVVQIRSGIDRAGTMSLWDYQVYGAGARSTEQFYDVPNHLVRAYGHWSREPGPMQVFATGPWRGPGANVNVFARESQVDIMAAKANADPLAFRLANTSDPRMRGVLKAAAERFGWKAAAGVSGRGYGIACAIDAGAYVALIAEVAVDKGSGRVQVKRFVCAQDMGQVINPDGAVMQMEGCLTMALGYALTESLRFRGGEILDRNFDTYELPRFSSLPAIETVLVKNDALAPQGGGEPAIAPVGAAIANAICDATGARLFRMPMTPGQVKKALAGS